MNRASWRTFHDLKFSCLNLFLDGEASSQAWVTLATNDSYALGALVLAGSLRNSGTTRKIVIMVTPEGLSDPMKSQLNQAFDQVVDVTLLDSKDQVNLALLERPELGVTFTKLHCWCLVQYSKCVFLDADTMVIVNFQMYIHGVPTSFEPIKKGKILNFDSVTSLKLLFPPFY